ncbi:hypothetical protein [Croceicoccus sp. BE223]|uniref:linalool dehydratase/isomerase domain-containing protein n=1 Tax=Croceicoccus sp. BE223 TaxID=2817716 RepID=UPI002857871A|nr:hypothetical protein [Croceicoccus sp. BE223]MDR7102348.1 hypothetical protein [Croceicoccus sp. BE223]
MTAPPVDVQPIARARIVDAIPPIPDIRRMHGPITRSILARFYLMQAAVFIAGMLPVVLGMNAQWKAFGLGIVLPGGGFFFAGGLAGILLGALSVAVFAVIMFIWWARGVVLGPPAVLVGTALLSAAWIEGGSGLPVMEYLVPLAFIGLHAGLALDRRRKFTAARRRASEHNAAIAKIEPVLRKAPIEASPEMPAGQIGEYRRMLDLALQPVDEWKGFAFNDTWQDGALRYQICTMSWNLAFGQYTQLPAFHGYLNTAQENLIRKHIDRKTWNYWYWESLWGNLKVSKNPVEIDNIMLSGFLGVSLGLFETSSGTSPFSEPGSLTFRFDEHTAAEYNHETMLREVVKNYKRYDYGWFPCEPRWIYSMCNLVGRTALSLHDARHGTDMIGQIGDRFDQTMRDEMLLPDGRIRVCTSSTFGFTVPSLSGLFGETWGIRFMTPYAPDEAERLWAIMKRDFIRVNEAGELDFHLLPLGWDTRKPANFSYEQWPELNPLTMTLWAAQEMGDDPVIEATRRTMNRMYGDGVADAVSWTRANTVRDMVNTGLPEKWRTGPLLTEATYPDVVVTCAVSDGQRLDLVLVPGEGPVEAKLGLGRLRPGQGYRVIQTGETLVAGLDGTARFSVPLAERRDLTILPAG